MALSTKSWVQSLLKKAFNKAKDEKYFGDSKVTADDSLTEIKFGVDADGNYGYYKVGADTVTPFKSGLFEYRMISCNKAYGTRTVSQTYTADEDCIVIAFLIAGNANSSANVPPNTHITFTDGGTLLQSYEGSVVTSSTYGDYGGIRIYKLSKGDSVEVSGGVTGGNNYCAAAVGIIKLTNLNDIHNYTITYIGRTSNTATQTYTYTKSDDDKYILLVAFASGGDTGADAPYINNSHVPVSYAIRRQEYFWTPPGNSAWICMAGFDCSKMEDANTIAYRGTTSSNTFTNGFLVKLSK